MHASFATITTEVDADPTLVMFGLSFDDDDDDAPTRQVAPPSEVLTRNPARESMASLPDEEVPVMRISSVEVVERPAFALELLPLPPSALARFGRAVLRWAPYAALGASAGLLLCIGASAFADAITAPNIAAASPVVHVASPSVPAPPAAVVAPIAPMAAAEVIELDDARPTNTVARRARPIAPASRPVVRVNNGTSARLPPLAAMPAQYTKW